MIKNNYDAKKVIMGFIEEELVNIEAKKIKKSPGDFNYIG